MIRIEKVNIGKVSTAHPTSPYSLFSLPYSLFPVPYSLFPKIQKLCTS
ncbi:MAG: hypothetical protein F6J90_13730 [Moorea sp. SIOASIH]|nr:hypothetical protein [Moorena sp. SIOASIH]NEO37326.1 hypothetical protein [Moorena sp. SIOASIH]